MTKGEKLIRLADAIDHLAAARDAMTGLRCALAREAVATALELVLLARQAQLPQVRP